MVELELKNDMIGFVKGLVPETALPGLGFGVLGNMILGGTYGGIMQRADELLKDAETTLDGWNRALTNCQRNWRAAEDASIVRYRA
jgi:hypothetical protein